MSRDLTRDDVRAIVRRGLERTGGNYRVMVELFNMPTDDYKRFLGVLRKYQCHMPFQQFRSAASTRPGVKEQRESRNRLFETGCSAPIQFVRVS